MQNQAFASGTTDLISSSVMEKLILALALVAITSAQVITFSKCPKFKVQQDFDPARVS